MRIDLWQHGLGGICLLQDLLMLLEQYGFGVAEFSGDLRNSSTVCQNDTVAHQPEESKRSDSHEHDVFDRRPDVQLSHDLSQSKIAYQQLLREHDPAETQGSTSESSLLSQHSVLIQNHIMGLCKQFMKWLDEIDEHLREGLEDKISTGADKLRVQVIEHFKHFFKQYHRQATKLHIQRPLAHSILPGSRYASSHMRFVSHIVLERKKQWKKNAKGPIQVSLKSFV